MLANYFLGVLKLENRSIDQLLKGFGFRIELKFRWVGLVPSWT